MTLFSSAGKSPSRPHRDEDGYIMLTLLLIVTLMVITATAVLPVISYEIRRGQEQEMIHRGVQYSRAIRAYYKKFGRYPTRLEDLDNTSNLRYLRKHYKDPITGKDFKLLHYGEPGVTLAGGIAGGTIPGANPIGSPGGLNSPGSNSAFGGGSSPSGFGNTGFGNSGVNNSGVFSQPSAFGGNGNSASSQPGTNPAAGSDATQASTQVKGTGQGDEASSSQLVVSGPIVGVASTSKSAGFHEFNHKKKYNEWQFVYDPATDRGGLITTPNQPTLQGFGGAPNLNNGQPGSSNGSQPGQSPFGQSSFGQSGFGQSSFGQPGGSNNNPNPTPPPTPPANPPQQQ